MKKVLSLLLVGLFVLGVVGLAKAEKVEITYWQYFYQTKKDTINELIKEFEQENPDITVNHVTFPYENYNTKVASSIPAGVGPNVINLYYGWLPTYIDAGYLQPLSKEYFDPVTIEQEFFPLVQAAKIDDSYYALPTAVRSLALIWNKDRFQEVGLDPEAPPKTLEQMLEYVQLLTETDRAGNVTKPGMTVEVRGQMHHWIREVLVRQFGGVPYAEDNRSVTYNDQGGYDGFEFFTDLTTKHKFGKVGFMTDDVTAFKSGRVGMYIDGSFRIGTLNKLKNLDYGIAELPSHNGIKSNFASFWANGITRNTKGKELAASIKFLQFLTSDKAMELWLQKVGELPAKPAVALQEKNANHPQYGPFIKGLEYAHATYFVDEKAQRQVWIDAYDLVRLKEISVKDAVDQAAETEQKVLDKYYQDK